MGFYELEGIRPQASPKAFIHPEAVLIGRVRVDPGCYIGAGAVLRGDFGSIFVGPGSNVQENCVLHTLPDQEVILHENTHIGHASILHGCEICSEVLVGMGSIVMDQVKINQRCLVGAGSLIPAGTEIPSDSLVLGSPASVKRSLTQADLEKLRWARSVYQNLARRCLKSLRPIEAPAVLLEDHEF